jgi:hypothetical protein
VKQRDARLVLPGELVRLGDRTLKVHHVEVIPLRNGDDPLQAEVIVCFSTGPHPDWDASSGRTPQWPLIAVKPGEKVDVLPAKPKVTTTWDETSGKWKVDVVEPPAEKP